MRVLTDSAHDVAVAKSPLHSLTQRCKKTWDRDLWCAPFENREECGSLDGVGEERVGQPPNDYRPLTCRNCFMDRGECQ
jgi:hypothetical protein